MQVYRGLNGINNQPLALTIGNFDGVHLGHQALLQQLRVAAKQRGLLTAVMTFEPHPREFFTPSQAPARLSSLRDKLEMFAQLGIDRVYVCRFNHQFAQKTATEFMQSLQTQLCTRYLLIGDDFRFGSGRAGDFTLMRELGGRLNVEVEALQSVMHGAVRISSTEIRAALGAGQLGSAQHYLGRHFSICGRVVHGDAMGRKLGFPTANVSILTNRPALQGIYVVHAHVQNYGVLQGVASLGIRPTVKLDAKPVLEVHLFEFSQKIYGKRMRVEFLQKLRDEEKYPDLESLTRQIALDVQQAQSWFAQHA